MTTAVLDPKLKDFANQIETALAGGPMPKSGYGTTGYGTSTDHATLTRDATTVASSLLSAYHSAVLVNPSKAYKSKAIAPDIQISSPSEVTDKSFWDDVWTVVQTTGPVLINALSKDYQPATPNLASIIQNVPAHRRNDKDWVDFTTDLLFTLAQGAIQSLSGQKDFSDPSNRPQMPQPPRGADKGFFDDAFDFIQDAAPVALPIIMSLI